MDSFLLTGIALVGAAAVGFITLVVRTVGGALLGWCVGLVFDDTLVLLSEAMGIVAEPYQLGAMFGFVGGFFRSSLSVEKE